MTRFVPSGYQVRQTPNRVKGVDTSCRHLSHTRAKRHTAHLNDIRLGLSYRYEVHQTVSPWWWPLPTWECVAMQNVLVPQP